jgi:hypothetical protein
MKKLVYYVSFTFLGALFGFFLHAMVEILYIKLLLMDFDRYGFGLTWKTWEELHTVSVVVLVLGFGIWGYGRGQHFWKVLYVDQKYAKWVGKLKQNF